MSRRKRTSKVLEQAERRASSLKSIAKNLNLGNGLTLEAYLTLIEKFRIKQDSYNTALSEIDRIYNEMLGMEEELADFSELMLIGVAGKYGKKSNEYEMAGGVRKNNRKRPSRTPDPIGASIDKVTP